VLAVTQVVLARLEAAVTGAEAERSRARARALLVAEMVDLAVEQRGMAVVLQRDPVMLRFLESYAPFPRVIAHVNRLLMGGASNPRGTGSGRDARGGHRRRRYPPARPGPRRREPAFPAPEAGAEAPLAALNVSRRGRGGRTPRHPRP